MNHLAISGFLICLTSILCAFMSYFPQPRNAIKTVWSLFCLSVSLWGFGLYKGFSALDQETVLQWSRGLNLAALFIPILFFHFVLLFINQSKEKTRELIAHYFFGALFITVVVIFPSTFIPKVSPKFSFAFYPDSGFLYYLFFAYFILTNAYSVFLLLREHAQSTALRKYQIRFILFGVTMGFAGGATTFLPVFNIPVYPFGTYLVTLYVFLVAYSILRYRLMDINVLVGKLAQYLLVIGIFSLAACVIFILPKNIFAFFGIRNDQFLFFTFFVLGIVVFENKIRFDEFVGRTIHHKQYLAYSMLEKQIFSLNRLINYHDVLQEIEVIGEGMGIRNLSFYIQEKSFLHYFNLVLKTGKDHPPYPERLDTGTSLVKYIVEENRIIETDEFRHNYGHLYKKDKIIDYEKHGIQESMDILKAKIIIPIEIKGVILGILFIGEKVTGGRYTQQDLEIIKLLGYQVTNAIENIQLYERMLDTERLSTLGIMAAEIAHEIRNPLTGVISMINLLPRMKDNPGYLEKFMGIVPGELQRVINITASLMEFARPSHLMFEEIDLKNIVEQTLDLLGSKITGRNLKITREMDELPSISADKQQLKQVILNILLNAIDASPEGAEITLRAELPKNESHSILLSIKDRGEGIEKEKLDKIFLPFFTTKVNGCGLGLSICKRIIEEHHGDIHVESEEGKGSTFYIRLPLRR